MVVFAVICFSGLINQLFSKNVPNTPEIETGVTEESNTSSRSWSTDSLDRASSVVSSASSEMSVYDDKDVDLQVYLNWDDLERGDGTSAHRNRLHRPGLIGDSSSGEDSVRARRFDLSVKGLVTSSADVDVGMESDPTTSFWIPSG